MSYCRWSTDDFNCDLYCYMSDHGYMTHVASNRQVGEIPPLLPFPQHDAPQSEWTDYAARMSAQHAWLATCERTPIGGPHDGTSYCDSTAVEWVETLTMLREAGYHFPDHVLDAAREEAAEEEKAP